MTFLPPSDLALQFLFWSHCVSYQMLRTWPLKHLGSPPPPSRRLLLFIFCLCYSSSILSDHSTMIFIQSQSSLRTRTLFFILFFVPGSMHFNKVDMKNIKWDENKTCSLILISSTIILILCHIKKFFFFSKSLGTFLCLKGNLILGLWGDEILDAVYEECMSWCFLRVS